jgi:hypothetical protein
MFRVVLRESPVRNLLPVAITAALLSVSACSAGTESPKPSDAASAQPAAAASPETAPAAGGAGAEKRDDPAAKPSGVAEAAKAVGQDAKALGKDVVATTKEGAQLVARKTEQGVEKTVGAVKEGWERTVQTSAGVVTKVDEKARTITVKTKDGVEHVYEVSKDSTITVGRKIGRGGEALGLSIKEGAEVTVRFVDQSGKKIAHAVEQK